MAQLSLNRVKTIMKTADGADNINKEAIFLTTRATELFIKTLVKEGYNNTNKSKKLVYNNLVNVIHNSSRYEFLEIVIPKKITVREFKELMARKEREKQENGEKSSNASDSGSSDMSSNEDSD